jgi:hypothetical protein
MMNHPTGSAGILLAWFSTDSLVTRRQDAGAPRELTQFFLSNRPPACYIRRR